MKPDMAEERPDIPTVAEADEGTNEDALVVQEKPNV